jgi:cytochrome P450
MTENVDAREAGDFFLNDPEKLHDPFPDLKYFRENRPVFYYEPFEQWFVFGYDDAAGLFHDPRLSADRMKGFVDAAPPEVREDVRKVAPYLELFVLFNDDPDHARMRKFLHRGFNLDAVHRLKDQIQEATDALLDRVQDRGRFDVCADFAFLLPAYVLSDFLGVHKEDRDRVVQWSVDFIDFFNNIPITEDTASRMVLSASEMIDYTKDLLAERRAEPRDDFLGTLASAEAEEGALTEEEIVANAMLLLLAGHVAVRNLVGNVVYLLLTHPDQRSMVQEDPDLLNDAIEETLRYEPPVILIPRVALEDFDLRGNAIRKGQIVQLSIASANRDESHFPDAERFDISRKPGRYLSFGFGPHGCLGAPLAKQETRIALETLFRRMPDLRLDESREIVWYRNAANRGPINLPLVF